MLLYRIYSNLYRAVKYPPSVQVVGGMLLFFLLIDVENSIAQQVKRLYLGNDDHTDYMWTANEAEYDSAFVHMLDYYLDEIEKTSTNLPDFQARFNCDGSYWLRAYEKYRSPQQFNRLIKYVRSGHISSPLNLLVSTFGAQPTEAVIRGMYHAGQMERDHQLRFRMAVCMENQTLPLGLSSLWAGAGAKYSWRGVCGCASRLSNESLSHRRHQLYKYTGLDGRSVTMKWYARTIFNGRTLGGYAEARRENNPIDPAGDMQLLVADMDKMCDTISRNSRYPFNIGAAFGYGWDDLETYVSDPFIVAAQKGTNASRKVRVAVEEDFFKDVDRSYLRLPVESVSYGNEWDTYCVSMNETTARVRRSLEKLRTAEALSVLVALKNRKFGQDLTVMRNLAWESYGLYWEHDWTADGPVTRRQRADWQNKICRQITSYTDTLYNRANTALSQMIPSVSSNRIYVFNPLSWTRNDIADWEYNGTDPVTVIDLSTKKEVASQLIEKGSKKYIRFWAENIPSVGYKTFEIKKRRPAPLPMAATVAGEVVSNKFYHLRLRKSGVISEWFDRAQNKQLVKVINGRFLNDLGSTNPNDGQELLVENAGPVSVTLKAVSQNPIAHIVRVTLFANSTRVDIEDSIIANFKNVQQWSFSFDLDRPTTRHEELGAIITAKKENEGGHYASQNARYDWQTFNHFADMSSATNGITLSNIDCSFFKLGQSTPDSLWSGSSQINALAGGQTDPYTTTPGVRKDTVMMGIYNQDGQTQFRYQFALASHAAAFNERSAMMFSLEHQNPLVVSKADGKSELYPAHSFSLIKSNDSSVILWSVKPAEEGIENGLITRWWNLKGSDANPVISSGVPFQKAFQTSHIETNEHSLPVIKGVLAVGFSPYQINTYRVFF